MNYETAKAFSAKIDREVIDASAAFRTFPRLPNGLTPDDVKARPEWKAVRKTYRNAFHLQRAVNAYLTSEYPGELRADREAARAGI